MSIPFLRIIVALDEDGGFAKDGKIPWNLPEDFAHFQKATAGHHCIMGRRTAEDIFRRRRDKERLAKMYDQELEPTENLELLPGRTSIVLSRNPDLSIFGAQVVPDLGWALQRAIDPNKQTYILGGEKLFIESIAITKAVTITMVPGVWGCDRKFPLKYLMENFRIVDGKTLDNSSLQVVEYVRVKAR
jgi:dihydrofolate reductase